jgi:hypothetical protein
MLQASGRGLAGHVCSRGGRLSKDPDLLGRGFGQRVVMGSGGGLRGIALASACIGECGDARGEQWEGGGDGDRRQIGPETCRDLRRCLTRCSLADLMDVGA